VTASEAPAAPPATQPSDEAKQKEAPKEADAIVADKFDDAKPGEKAMIAAEAGEDRAMKKSEGARAQPARPVAKAATSGSLIAKSGRVVLESDDPGKVAERVGGVVASQRGYVQSRSGGKTRSGAQSVELVVRVPSENFDSVIASLRSLGTVVDVSTSAVNVARELAAVEGRAGESGRENKDARARSDVHVARSREEILDRVRMATIRLSVTPRPRTQSSATVTEPRQIDPAAMVTSGGPADRMRRAIGRGVDRAFDGAFVVLLGMLEYGPSALLVGGAIAAGIRGVRRVNSPGPTRSRVTTPLS
jgi:hypothetical protein